jgi:hypothetical protein
MFADDHVLRDLQSILTPGLSAQALTGAAHAMLGRIEIR